MRQTSISTVRFHLSLGNSIHSLARELEADLQQFLRQLGFLPLHLPPSPLVQHPCHAICFRFRAGRSVSGRKKWQFSTCRSRNDQFRILPLWEVISSLEHTILEQIESFRRIAIAVEYGTCRMSPFDQIAGSGTPKLFIFVRDCREGLQDQL